MDCLENFIEDLKHSREGREFMQKGISHFPNDEDFEKIVGILTSLYNDDNNVYAFINDNDFVGLADYLKDFLYETLEHKFGYLLNYGVIGQYLDARDFDKVYNAFMKNVKYHREVSLEEHLRKNFAVGEDNPYYRDYINWLNLINEFNDSVSIYDFSKIYRVHTMLRLFNPLMFTLNLYNDDKYHTVGY